MSDQIPDQTLERLTAFGTETNDYAGMAQDEYGDAIAPYREGAIEAPTHSVTRDP